METAEWQIKFDEQAEKYHRIGAWVAITLDLLWFISDYFDIPEHWVEFFWIRLSVSILTLITFVLYRKLSISNHWMIFVPFLGIAIQNAYMYSVMDELQLQKHTFAYIALFIGAGMLILWKPIYSFIVIGLNLIANLIFFPLFSDLELGEILINGGLLTFTVSIFTILLIHTRYTLTRKEIQSRIALEKSKKEVEEAHNDVKASINYAERIQRALLAGDESWEKIGSDRFILFKPRDIVSGDFYWGFANEDLAIWAAADCTGHGVPGAFMSMLGVGLLNEIVAEGKVYNPAEILNRLRHKIIQSLEQKGGEARKDGMDIALCVLHRKTNLLEYAGAHNSLWVVRKADNPEIKIIDVPREKDVRKLEENNFNLIEVKADAMPLGKFQNDTQPFTLKKLQLEKGDQIFTFSDGYQDQFGGDNGGKYMSKTFKKFILSIADKSSENQGRLLDEEIMDWMNKGNESQLDDICIIGVKI